MTEPQVNPWSNTPSLDVEKTFAEFGIDPIAPVSGTSRDPVFHSPGIVVGQRDYLPIARAIRNHTPFHLLTGFMPSGHPHLGHLISCVNSLACAAGWKRVHGDSDREAYAVRGLSWEKCREFGKEYLSCLYASGLKDRPIEQNRAQDLRLKRQQSKLLRTYSIYGFTPETALAPRTASLHRWQTSCTSG